jgi:hypothetical protein
MRETWLRKVVMVVIAGALLAALVRVLRGGPAPQFARNQVPVGIRPALVPAPTGPSGTWAQPIDGTGPPGFPVKAKLSSGIFHVPGGLSYDRTNPDRCYPTAEAAEADGLRAAKR